MLSVGNKCPQYLFMEFLLVPFCHIHDQAIVPIKPTAWELVQHLSFLLLIRNSEHSTLCSKKQRK